MFQHTLFHSNPLLQGRASVPFPLQYVRLRMNNGRDCQLNIEMKSEESNEFKGSGGMSNNCSLFAFSGSNHLSMFDILTPNSCVGMEEVLAHQSISKG